MKLKFAMGAALALGMSATANAASPTLTLLNVNALVPFLLSNGQYVTPLLGSLGQPLFALGTPVTTLLIPGGLNATESFLGYGFALLPALPGLTGPISP